VKSDSCCERAPRTTADGSRRGHFVYIVRCADGTLYTGYARDPERRAQVHNAGRGASYTVGRRPVSLVYSEAFTSVGDALSREHQVKRLSRALKERLIASRSRKGSSA
jgi:putative endonuclease